MTLTNFVKPLVVFAAVLRLPACSNLPFPMDGDLKAKIPEADTEGTVSEPIKEGEAETLDLYLPTEVGESAPACGLEGGAAVARAMR